MNKLSEQLNTTTIPIASVEEEKTIWWFITNIALEALKVSGIALSVLCIQLIVVLLVFLVLKYWDKYTERKERYALSEKMKKEESSELEELIEL